MINIIQSLLQLHIITIGPENQVNAAWVVDYLVTYTDHILHA